MASTDIMSAELNSLREETYKIDGLLDTTLEGLQDPDARAYQKIQYLRSRQDDITMLRAHLFMGMRLEKMPRFDRNGNWDPTELARARVGAMANTRADREADAYVKELEAKAKAAAEATAPAGGPSVSTEDKGKGKAKVEDDHASEASSEDVVTVA